MAEVNPPQYEQSGCYSAEQMRAQWGDIICESGVTDKSGGGMLVTSVASTTYVSVAAGSAWIEGTLNGSNGYYRVDNDSDRLMVIGSNADPTLTRIDLIIASVYDAEYVGASNAWALEIITGTPGAGTPTVPVGDRVGYLTLASVAVPPSNATPSVVTDLRTQAAFCSSLIEVTAPQVDYFTVAGANTWNKPAGAKRIRVRCVGGGGGGGGSAAAGDASHASSGGGGGGGAYAEKWFSADSLPDAVSLSVGAGGSGGTGSTGVNGGAGGVSWFSAVPSISASGGAGGGSGGSSPITAVALAVSSGANGGAGGDGTSSGGLVVQGGDGSHGFVCYDTAIFPGSGGGNPLGPRSGMTRSTTSATGVAGKAYGQGGWGSSTIASGPARNGGSGAVGAVIVETFF